jgi:hypothetical protein
MPTTAASVRSDEQHPTTKPAVEHVAEAPPTRPAIVTLRFSTESVDAIVGGTKTSTCRRGVREFPGNVAIATDGKRNLNLVILSAVSKTMNDLTADDAKAEGADSLDTLKTAVRKAYPGIKDDDTLTVVRFHVGG